VRIIEAVISFRIPIIYARSTLSFYNSNVKLLNIHEIKFRILKIPRIIQGISKRTARNRYQRQAEFNPNRIVLWYKTYINLRIFHSI